MTLYHVTQESYLPSIEKNGLDPKRGGAGGATQVSLGAGEFTAHVAADMSKKSIGRVHFTSCDLVARQYVKRYKDRGLSPVILTTTVHKNKAHEFREDPDETDAITTFKKIAAPKLSVITAKSFKIPYRVDSDSDSEGESVTMRKLFTRAPLEQVNAQARQPVPGFPADSSEFPDQSASRNTTQKFMNAALRKRRYSRDEF